MAYLNLTKELRDHVSQFVKKSKEVDRIVARIKKQILSLEDRDYWVVGYGSIINARSRDNTFPEGKQETACVVEGYKRVFDLTSTRGSYANVRVCEGAKINCVAVRVDGGDMIDFILREFNYQMVEVGAVLADGSVVSAMMVVAEENLKAAVPRLDYIQAIIFGMMKLSGKEGVQEFLDNSFLADGETTIREWIATLDLVAYCSKFDSAY